MPILPWISDQALSDSVESLLKVAKAAKKRASMNFGINVVDPFSAIFEIAGFDTDYTFWRAAEETRQAQKTLQNSIGSFHQFILGSCNGWANKTVGNIVDLVNQKDKYIAEIKNKYNTLTYGRQADLYHSLEDAVMKKLGIYKGYTAYYVTIIPQTPKRFNNAFTPSDPATGNKCAINPLIRIIDGASFYEIATGYKDALKDLYTALPDVINAILPAAELDKPKLEAIFKLAYG